MRVAGRARRDSPGSPVKRRTTVSYAVSPGRVLGAIAIDWPTALILSAVLYASMIFFFSAFGAEVGRDEQQRRLQQYPAPVVIEAVEDELEPGPGHQWERTDGPPGMVGDAPPPNNGSSRSGVASGLTATWVNGRVWSSV